MLERLRTPLISGPGWTCGPDGHTYTTDRLHVRPVTPDDMDALRATIDDVCDFRMGYSTSERSAAEYYKADYDFVRHPAEHEDFVVTERHSGEVVGSRVLTKVRANEVTTGGWIAASLRRQGLGSEELRGLMRLVSQHLGFTHVAAATEIDNAAARALYLGNGMGLAEEFDHQLPNGRAVRAVWMRGTAKRVQRTCHHRGVGLRAPWSQAADGS